MFSRCCLPAVFSLLSRGQLDFMKFVTRRVSKSHHGNKFHEITLAMFSRFCLPAVFSLLSRGQLDFMKFVTRRVSKSHPGNKFHDITMAFFARVVYSCSCSRCVREANLI